MNNDWASENLHVIRTLMERSAVYRRALGPILLYLGAVGLLAGLVGPLFNLKSSCGFVIYWGCVGIVSLGGSLLLARRQAIKDAEPFWSPPTRHVSQALFPPLVAGGVAGVAALLGSDLTVVQSWLVPLLPAIWMVFYGCALASAGFFMRKGMRVLGWIFLWTGILLLLSSVLLKGVVSLEAEYGHFLMGCSFGLLHLVAGLYLTYSKEPTNTL